MRSPCSCWPITRRPRSAPTSISRATSQSPSRSNRLPGMAEQAPTPEQDLGADVRAASQKGVWARLRNYFLTGLVVAGPVAITAWLIWSFVTWVDGFIRPFIPPAYRPETYLPWPIPGTGLIVALVLLTLLGFLTANLVGRTLVGWGEGLLNRMPI